MSTTKTTYDVDWAKSVLAETGSTQRIQQISDVWHSSKDVSLREARELVDQINPLTAQPPTKTRLPAARLRERLRSHQESLAELAADFRRLAAETDDTLLKRNYVGMASGYELALHSLHSWTYGEFGQSLEEQRDGGAR